MALLSVRDLVVRFHTHDGTVHAVNGVSFDLEEGETLGLVGESGCGKSVTNLAVMRLLPAPAGKIVGGHVYFEDEDLIALDESEMRELRGKEVAMIFQDPMTSLNPVLTIEEQMVETIKAHKKVSKAEARARTIELLAMVGIPKPEGRLRDYPHQFSGGMRQRVMIAMALALEPKLLIADEPTTALDVTIQAQVLELLSRLAADHGTAVILITHDLGVVAGMTRRINVMYAGFVVETATTGDLFARPAHPYTVGLMHSMPRLDAQPGEPLIPIEGTPPDLRFAPSRLLICAALRLAPRPLLDGNARSGADRGHGRGSDDRPHGHAPLGLLEPADAGRGSGGAPAARRLRGRAAADRGAPMTSPIESTTAGATLAGVLESPQSCGDAAAAARRRPADVLPDNGRDPDQPPRRRREGRRRCHAVDPEGRDGRPRRRVRVRQEHRGSGHPAPVSAHRRQCPVRRSGHHDRRRVDPARRPTADADDLPGPVRQPEPAG